MDQVLRTSLAHVLWIGGATDSGKTTVAQLIAERHGLQVYHYDRYDLPHHQRLAQTDERHRWFLEASFDEKWVYPEPEELAEHAMRSFRDRFPLMVEDLLTLPRAPVVLAEGFGLLPSLIEPVLSSQRQAIWLVSTDEFKWASMQRRHKPSFADQTSDPQRATQNLFRRDRLLAQYVKAQAQTRGLTVYTVDGSRSAEQMVSEIEQHFAPWLAKPYAGAPAEADDD